MQKRTGGTERTIADEKTKASVPIADAGADFDAQPRGSEALPALLTSMLHASADLAFVKDTALNYICASCAFAHMVGLSDEKQIAGKTDFDLFEKKLAEQYRADDFKLLENGESLVNYLERIPSKDDTVHYSRTSKYILRDADGKIIGLYGTGRDVTEDRMAYEQLKLITDSIPGGIATYAISPDGMKISYFNDGFCRMLGCTREAYEKLANEDVLCLVFPEDVPILFEQAKAIVKDGTPINCTYRIKRPDGRIIHVNLRGALGERHGDTCFVNAVFYDITDQKQTEQVLRVHQEEIKLALSQMSRIIAEFDIENRTLTLPDIYYQEYDFPPVASNVPYSMQSVGNMTNEAFDVYCKFYEAIISGENPAPIEIEKRKKDGTPRYERMTAYTVFSEDGRPVKALVASDDTTEQHHQYALERSRPMLAEKDLLVHALFNLTTGETLDYTGRSGRVIPPDERTAFTKGRDNLDRVIVGEEDRARFRELNDPAKLIARFEAGETELSIDYRRRLLKGDVIWVKNLLRLVREPGGSDVLLFEYCYDINEEKTRERMLSSIVQSAYDYVANVNLRTKKFSVCANEDVVYGLPPEGGEDIDEVIAAFAEAFVHPDDREATVRAMRADGMRENLKKDDRFQFVCRELTPDGNVCFKKLTQYYLDRETGDVIVTREDVTQIMEEENRKSAALADALEAANQASRAKTAFLSRMSHELRTPMNAIIGLSALSATELNDRNAMENNIGKIGISARYLLALINDILEMSRIESGRMTLAEEPFDFEKLISDVNGVIYSQASAKGVDYDVIVQSYTEPVYVGDVVKMQEILVNVLGNAVKVTPAGGKITLNIEQLRCVKGRALLRFTATDTGVGIDEDFLPHLFDAFSQESASFTSTSTGTGLGLAITKNLVEMMNGQIQVRSIKNVGSVFTIDVQLGISDESRQQQDLMQLMKLDDIRTLVVDDDVTVCRSTENILKSMGMRVEWVDSGLSAVERVEKMHTEKTDYDTIFIDWKMPDIDGIETTRRIRKIVGPNVTIIIMTAYDWKDIEREAISAGVNTFMEKPLFQSSVVRAFEKIFLKSREKEKPKAPAMPDFTGRRILLAEDHPLNVEVARRLLEKAGAKVTVAQNGLEALETFATSDDGCFDAILMDIRMPEMDGLTATKSIRKLKKAHARDIPIIAMTANAFDEDVELSLRSGMNAHLNKPIEPAVLYATLGRLMK